MLHPLALPAQWLTKGSDKSCTEDPVNSMISILILARTPILSPTSYLWIACGNILQNMLQKTLPCSIYSFYYFVSFSEFVLAIPVFILKADVSRMPYVSLKIKFWNELAFYLSDHQSLFFSPSWVRRQKPSVPVHVPSSEGCTVSGAFQKHLKSWGGPWARASESWRCDPDLPEVSPWTDL